MKRGLTGWSGAFGEGSSTVSTGYSRVAALDSPLCLHARSSITRSRCRKCMYVMALFSGRYSQAERLSDDFANRTSAYLKGLEHFWAKS